MARHHHHRHRPPKQEAQKILMTVMCALLGLTFGIAGGRFLTAPLQIAKPAARVSDVKSGDATSLPAAGAPLAERIAAAGRMDEDALSGVLAAVHDAEARSGSLPEHARRSMLYLRIVFSRWTDLNGPNAVKAALGLKDKQLSDMALDAAMTEWALRDTQTASQSLTLIPWAAAQERALAALIRAGVQRSPAEGFAITDKITLAPANLLRRAAAAEWMRRDAGHALRFLMEHPGIGGTVPAGGALGQWLLEDPAGFMAWRRKEPAVANSISLLRFPAEAVTPGHLTRLASVLVKELGSMETGAAWLRETGGPAAVPVVLTLTPPQAAAQAEMKSWQESVAALPDAATPGGWLARRAHARTLRLVASIHAATDPAAALEWLAALPPEEEAARLAPAAAAQWLTHAPATAPEQLFAGSLTNPVLKAAASMAANFLVRANPLKSLQMLPDLKLDPDAARSLETAAFRQLAASAPDAMLEWLEARPGTALPAGTLSTALKSAAAADALHAFEWAQRHAPAGDRPGLMADIFGIWIQKDRVKALQVLESLPAGRDRDAAIAQLVSADTAMDDPLLATNILPDCFAQALHYSGDAGRLDALRRVLRRMAEMKISTDTSLNHRGLRPADREALLKNP